MAALREDGVRVPAFHHVKVREELWDDLSAGRKKADLRLDDREGGYREGDVLIMRRLVAQPLTEAQRTARGFLPSPFSASPSSKCAEPGCGELLSDYELEDGRAFCGAHEPPQYDEGAPPMLMRITHRLEGGQYGLAEGWVMLSLEKVILTMTRN